MAEISHDPVCPHCNNQIRTVLERHLGVKEKVFYICPECHRVLSVSSR